MSAPEPLVLYTEAYWLSPWDLACWVTLREKGLPFARSVALMPGMGPAPELRAHTVMGRVPTLQHGEFWLTDSQVIIEYLEDVFAPPRHAPVLPREPRARARARQLSQYARNGLPALRRERPAVDIFYPGSARPPLGSDAAAEAQELIGLATRDLGGRAGFLLGDFGVVDVDVAFALQRLGPALDATLAAYVARVWARPSVHEYISHPRPPHPPPEDANTRR